MDNTIILLINALHNYDNRTENISITIRPFESYTFYNITFRVPYCFIPYPERHFLDFIQPVLPNAKNAYCDMITIDGYYLRVNYTVQV